MTLSDSAAKSFKPTPSSTPYTQYPRHYSTSYSIHRAGLPFQQAARSPAVPSPARPLQPFVGSSNQILVEAPSGEPARRNDLSWSRRQRKPSQRLGNTPPDALWPPRPQTAFIYPHAAKKCCETVSRLFHRQILRVRRGGVLQLLTLSCSRSRASTPFSMSAISRCLHSPTRC